MGWDVVRALLLSGGIESSCLAYLEKPEKLIFVDYGQVSAEGEKNAALRVSDDLGTPLDVIKVGLQSIGSGSMVKKPDVGVSPAPEWWPYRNQTLASVAGAWGLQNDVKSLIFGSISSDSFHKDGTKLFYDLLSKLMEYQEGGITVEAPALGLTPAELVKESKIPINILSLTHSCHTGKFSCGYCRGCRKHYQIFEQLGVEY